MSTPETAQGISSVSTIDERTRLDIERILGNPLEYPRSMKGWLETILTPIIEDAISARVPRFPATLQLTRKDRTSPLVVTATTEAGANTIMTCDPIDLDGETQVRIDFNSPDIFGHNEQKVSVALFDAIDGGAAASLGIMVSGTGLDGAASESTHHPTFQSYFATPVKGSHVFSARAWCTTASEGTIYGGAGGAGNLMPAFLRVSRA